MYEINFSLAFFFEFKVFEAFNFMHIRYIIESKNKQKEEKGSRIYRINFPKITVDAQNQNVVNIFD